MSPIDTQAQDIADLERLAAELAPRGGKTVLVTRDGRLPALDVVNRQHPGLCGRVYASAGHYWWASADPIAPRHQAAVAAGAITRTLALRPHA